MRLEKKAVSGIMLILVLTSMLTLVFNVQPVKARTIVVPGDYPTIQEAIIAANIGDTVYVKNGTYYENVVVDKAISLAGESRESTIIDANGVGDVVEVWASNVTITGFTIRNSGAGWWDSGMKLQNVKNCNVSGNNIRNNQNRGIYLGRDLDLSSSSNNTISGNNITDNNIGISGGSYNIISGNNISNNAQYGYDAVGGSHNIISGNNISNNARFVIGAGIFGGSYNSISGNKITNNLYGINRIGSNNSIIGNNITANRGPPINFDYSNYNSIVENNITDNMQGISLKESSNNSIVGNNITNSWQGGLSLSWSSNYNSIVGNTFTDNGLYVQALTSPDWLSGPCIGNVVKGNTVNGKPLVYLDGVSDYTVGDAGQVILVYSDNIRVENLNLSNATYGLQLWGTNNSRIINNNIANNWDGINLWYSNYNSISGNNITNNWTGTDITSSKYNSIVGNNITANYDGIVFGYFDHTYRSDYNSIVGNNITNNRDDGIDLDTSSNNSISGNNIANNKYGIYLYSTSGNIFYHNNFINNTRQIAIAYYYSTNIWDDGYPSGGNYWSDYTGVDLFSGVYQNESGTDGVGDTPYVINAVYKDRYPLKYPWGTPPNVMSFIVKPNIFSPNSDGRKDATTIVASFNTLVNWQLQIRTSAGKVIRSWTGTGRTLTIIWDGEDALGILVPDGVYKLRLSGADVYGPPFLTKWNQVIVDTTPPTVTGMSVIPSSFNPNLGETTTISYTLSEKCYVTIKIFNSAGKLVRTLLNNALQATGPHSIIWNGRDNSNIIVPPGTYTIKIFVVDRARNRATPYPIIAKVTVL